MIGWIDDGLIEVAARRLALFLISVAIEAAARPLTLLCLPDFVFATEAAARPLTLLCLPLTLIFFDFCCDGGFCKAFGFALLACL